MTVVIRTVNETILEKKDLLDFSPNVGEYLVFNNTAYKVKDVIHFLDLVKDDTYVQNDKLIIEVE